MVSFYHKWLETEPYGNSTHVEGVRFHQLFHIFPMVEPLYSDFEKEFDPIPIWLLVRKYQFEVPVICAILYFVICFIGPRIMQHYKPFDLQSALAAWNLSLALFSLYCMVRLVPHVIYRLTHFSSADVICERLHSSFGGGAVCLAAISFSLSKIPELLDTLFLVLRKKPLLFLHWYHHITVLFYCWVSMVAHASNAIYFAAMNCTVHTVMYSYYYMQSIKAVPKWFPVQLITAMQITQMFLGVFIIILSWYYKLCGGGRYKPGECHVEYSNLAIGGVMYATYLVLFVQFAIERFGSGKKKDNKFRAKGDNGGIPPVKRD